MELCTKPIDLLRASIYRRRSRYRYQLEDMAPALHEYWLRHAPAEFPGIPLTALFYMRAAEGLVNFFEVTQTASATYALPSLAADSVWHAWLRWDAGDLARFCRRHFGSPPQHLAHEALDALALPRALVACRRSDGIPPHGPALPRLFGLDTRLRMPSGHGYRQNGVWIDYARLDPQGRYRHDGKTHPALTPRALLAAGLITQMMFEEAITSQARAEQVHAVQTGGDLNFDCDSGSAADADGGGGGDGGGGCGGGCGGGGGD